VPLKSVLDCGCGPGATSIKLAEEFKMVEAFDYIPEFIQIVKK